MIKVICIFVNESHRLPLTLNHFYLAEATEALFINIAFPKYFIYNEDKTHYYGIYEKEHFMTLAEWREQKMKDILEDE